MRHLIKYGLLTLLAGLTACAPGEDVAGGAGAGNPGRPAALTCKAASETSGVPEMTDSSGTVFTISTASLHFEYISFSYPEDAAVPAEEFAFTSPLVYEDSTIVMNRPVCFNLLTGAPEPDPGLLTLPTGSYDKVKVKINDHSDSITALNMTGTFSYANRTDRPFSIALTFNNTAVFFSDPPISLEANESVFGLLIALNTAVWMQDIGITDALDSGTLHLESDGSLLIDDSQEHRYPELSTAIRTNIVKSGKLMQND